MLTTRFQDRDLVAADSLLFSEPSCRGYAVEHVCLLEANGLQERDVGTPGESHWTVHRYVLGGEGRRQESLGHAGRYDPY